jgi:hypothetical protein
MTNGQKSAHSREKNAAKIASKAKANQPKGDREAPVTKQCKACFKVSVPLFLRRVAHSLSDSVLLYLSVLSQTFMSPNDKPKDLYKHWKDSSKCSSKPWATCFPGDPEFKPDA